MQKQEKIDFVKKVLFKMFPNAKTELHYETEFQLLIAIIMSAQTTDKQVNKVNSVLFKNIRSPQDIIHMGLESLTNEIQSVSFFRNKARHILASSEILLRQYNSKVPNSIDELVKLPWVWIKTAKVFLSIIYNAPYLAVDTHVHRVLNRLGFVWTHTPLATNKAAENLFTKDDNAFLHHTLILFGRYHCTARKPQCQTCQFSEFCYFYAHKKNHS